MTAHFPEKFLDDLFLGFYPKNFYIFSLKNSDDFFFFFFFFFFFPFFPLFPPIFYFFFKKFFLVFFFFFFFFSHRPFSRSSRPIFFIIIALFNVIVTPLHPPSMHTHMLFYTFLCLLCALVTINTP